MPGDDRFTAYCGLYCKDCIPSDEKLYKIADELGDLLDDLQFEEYAALKAKTLPEFADYSTFVRVLQALKGLECKALCTGGGCKADCRIRECVREKCLRGCWLCVKFEDCELHESLKTSHPGLVHYFSEKDLVDQFAGFEVLETASMDDPEEYGEEGKHIHRVRCLLARRKG